MIIHANYCRLLMSITHPPVTQSITNTPTHQHTDIPTYHNTDTPTYISSIKPCPSNHRPIDQLHHHMPHSHLLHHHQLDHQIQLHRHKHNNPLIEQYIPTQLLISPMSSSSVYPSPHSSQLYTISSSPIVDSSVSDLPHERMPWVNCRISGENHDHLSPHFHYHHRNPYSKNINNQLLKIYASIEIHYIRTKRVQTMTVAMMKKT